MEFFGINKNINKIKLAITIDCNLQCNYCFVKKAKRKMNLNTAKRAVDLLIQSEGRDKLLSIYGGEPLLNFEIIERISPYAFSQAKRLNKNLIISICSNSTLLTEKHLAFFKKYNIRLIISMVGDKISHDRFRKFDSNKGTYKVILKKFPLIFKYIAPEYLGVSFCIFPSLVDKIGQNFRHLINLGFNYINFEIIRNYEPWTSVKIKRFGLELTKIINYIFSFISQRNFIFLNSVNWEIKYQVLTQSLNCMCPFNYNLEIYPEGEMAFSAFLLNAPDRENYIIGNINEKTLLRFNDCNFDPQSDKCQRCEYDYTKTYSLDKGATKAYILYRYLCRDIAKRIQTFIHLASFRDYIYKAREKICF